jgi:hypothetical protein
MGWTVAKIVVCLPYLGQKEAAVLAGDTALVEQEELLVVVLSSAHLGLSVLKTRDHCHS